MASRNWGFVNLVNYIWLLRGLLKLLQIHTCVQLGGHSCSHLPDLPPHCRWEWYPQPTLLPPALSLVGHLGLDTMMPAATMVDAEPRSRSCTGSPGCGAACLDVLGAQASEELRAWELGCPWLLGSWLPISLPKSFLEILMTSSVAGIQTNGSSCYSNYTITYYFFHKTLALSIVFFKLYNSVIIKCITP